MCPIFRKAPLLDLTIKEVNWPSLPLRHHGLMDKDGVTDGMGEKKIDTQKQGDSCTTCFLF